MSSKTSTNSALDESSAGKERVSLVHDEDETNGVKKLFENGSSKVDGDESELFRAGTVFERHKESGVSQDGFINLLFDLEKSKDSRWSTKEKVAVDFVAGRLFQRYCDSRVANQVRYLKPDQFKAILKQFAVQDIFLAGRHFERYAKSKRDAGLTAYEFQSLLRGTSLGLSILSKFKVDPNVLDSATPAKPTTTTTQKPQTRPVVSRAPASPTRPASPPASPPNITATTRIPQLQASRGRGNEADIAEDLLETIQRRLGQLEVLDKQINAFDKEATAEAALKTELPEAYSETKEKMLRDHITQLQEKRLLLIRSLKKLRRKREAANRGNLVPQTLYDPYLRAPYPLPSQALTGGDPYGIGISNPTAPMYPLAPYEIAPDYSFLTLTQPYQHLYK